MKTAIITGASSGIGKALAHTLSCDYDYIAICSRNKNKTLEEIRNNMLNINPQLKVDVYSGSVADYDFVQSMISNIVSITGRIDVLINNAGISKVGLLSDMTPEEWNEIVSINLTSIFNTCNTVVPHMVHQKSGRIINISSVWGNVGASCEVAYSATKGGINSFTKALAKELAPSNICVLGAALGAIDTPMNAHLSADEKTMLEDEIPFGRMATTDEAADFIQKLLNMPTYLTGEIIKFDGAWI